MSDFPQQAVSSAANQQGSSYGSHTLRTISRTGAICCIPVLNVVEGYMLGVVEGYRHQQGVHAYLWHTGSPFAALDGILAWCCIWVPTYTVLTCNLVPQGVSLMDVKSDAHTSAIGNVKSHGQGVALAVEQNIVGLPATQPISRYFCLDIADRQITCGAGQWSGAAMACIVMSAGIQRPACPDSTCHLLLARCTTLCPCIISLLSASGILRQL